jgi:hypothetical protein
MNHRYPEVPIEKKNLNCNRNNHHNQVIISVHMPFAEKNFYNYDTL